MGRNLSPSCKLCRREGIKLMLKGTRCDSAKCAMERQGHNNPPGAKRWRRGRTSEYGIRLREKQKVKRYYGVLERQFIKYFHMAEHATGNTGATLLCLLERRLDNVVHKLGFAPSRKLARELVSHGHVYINSRKVNIPSFLIRPGDRITSKPSPKSEKQLRGWVESGISGPLQDWLELNQQDLVGIVKALPTREDVQIPVEEQLIVELCSR